MNALLVRAVIIHDGRLLVARSDGTDFVFLPGGHVERGESLGAALDRELQEEIGLVPVHQEYAGFVEHAWRDKGVPVLELNHCFSASLPAGAEIASKERGLSFQWVPLAKLAQARLQPPALVSLITRYAEGNKQVWAEPNADSFTNLTTSADGR